MSVDYSWEWPKSDTCPACGASMRDQPIPDEQREHYAPSTTHYSRVIGVEVPGVYDGTLYWLCPDCGHKWHRFPEGHALQARAEKYVTAVTSPRVDVGGGAAVPVRPKRGRS